MPGHSAEALHDAILEALLNGGMLSDEMIEKLLGKDWQQADDAEERIERLVQQILDKLQRQGYLTSAPAPQSEMQDPSRSGQGGRGPEAPVRFEITDKSLDFLGYRALRDLLGIDRQEQPRTSRHARDGNRHRGERRARRSTSSATR